MSTVTWTYLPERTAYFHDEYTHRFGYAVHLSRGEVSRGNRDRAWIGVRFLRWERERQGHYQLTTQREMDFEIRLLSGATNKNLTTNTGMQFRHVLHCTCPEAQQSCPAQPCPYQLTIDVVNTHRAQPLHNNKKVLGEEDGKLTLYTRGGGEEYGFLFHATSSFVLQIPDASGSGHQMSPLRPCQQDGRFFHLGELNERGQRMASISTITAPWQDAVSPVPTPLPFATPSVPSPFLVPQRYPADNGDAHRSPPLFHHLPQPAVSPSLSTVSFTDEFLGCQCDPQQLLRLRHSAAQMFNGIAQLQNAQRQLQLDIDQLLIFHGVGPLFPPDLRNQLDSSVSLASTTSRPNEFKQGDDRYSHSA